MLHCGQGSSLSQAGATMGHEEHRMSQNKGKFPTLDLHGFKTDEVYDAVEAFLSKNSNAAKVKVMPGKGTGAVKAQVIDYLKRANYPWSYEKLPNGSDNSGVLIVHME